MVSVRYITSDMYNRQYNHLSATGIFEPFVDYQIHLDIYVACVLILSWPLLLHVYMSSTP